jgi:hypothetical protein
MAKTIKTTFAGGEMSPDLEGRVDLAKYSTGAQLIKNMFPTRFGGVINRPGMQFSAEARLSAFETFRLIPFVFNTSQTYMLEFSNDVMRVFKDNSIVLESIRNSTYKWTLSGSGINEYYLELASTGNPFPGNPAPAVEVWIDGAKASQATPGFLSPGQWGIGDNDGLTEFHIYVRLSDEVDPDTKAVDFIQKDYQLFTNIGYEKLDEMTFAQFKDLLFINGDFAPREIGRSADNVWTIANASVSPSVTAPIDVDITENMAGSPTKQYFYTVSAVDDLLNESLPIDEIPVTVDFSWTSTAKVEIFINSIVNSTKFQWTLSASGTSEYYLEAAGGGNPLINVPTQVWGNKIEMTEGTAGTLSAGEWDYADNDTLGFSTVYVRLTDSTDPDTKSTGWITYKSATDNLWNIYKNPRGDWGWLGEIDKPFFLDDDLEPDVSVTPKKETAPYDASDTQTYPWAVGVFQQRLFYARTNNKPQTVFGSVLGDLQNFSISQPLSTEDAIEAELASGGRADEIRHLLQLQKLLVFTTGSEFTMDNGANTDVLSPLPGGVNFRINGYVGCSQTVQPLALNDEALFVQRANRDIHNLRPTGDFSAYQGGNITLLVQHLFEDRTIVDWCWQQIPDNLIWVVMSDGDLVSITYLPEQEIIAFARHDTNGIVLATGSIPSQDEDQVYFIVKREIDGVDKYFVEYLNSRYFGENVRDAKFLDSALTYDQSQKCGRITVDATKVEAVVTSHGYSTGDYVLLDDIDGVEAVGDGVGINDRYYKIKVTTISAFELEDLDGNALTSADFVAGTYTDLTGTSRLCTKSITGGLEHLEGENVSVLADGQHLPGTFTVTNGGITLSDKDPGYAVVHVGLGYVSDLEPLRMEVPAGSSTVQTSLKTIKKMFIRMKNSSGGYAGPDEDNLTFIKWRKNERGMQPNDIKTGDVSHLMKSKLNRDGKWFFRQPDPLPTHILAVIIHFDIGDR